MRRLSASALYAAVLALSVSVLPTAQADTVKVAVAANFATPLEGLSAEFTKATGHTLVITPGSTGKLYAQIKNGAPFEVMLAADSKTPTKLVGEGLAEKDSQFTYAIGKLALWSTNASLLGDGPAVLGKGDYQHLSIANAELAPYGLAAEQALKKLGLYDQLSAKFVTGENIAQTYQFVETGNAELGFVAYSQVLKGGKLKGGSLWLVPADLYAPIKQDAVLLSTGKDNAAAKAFLEFLKSDAARPVIESFGYGME